ncbi:MAG: hypothetical protein GKR99_15330 [Rhodobacteraceae bacterium]|nr:hypothetical protein [Paracoccaceae bacterium]
MTEEAIGYQWISSGGCERCDNAAGYHEGAEPCRPHPNCVCRADPFPERKNRWSGKNYTIHIDSAKWQTKKNGKMVPFRKSMRKEKSLTLYADVKVDIYCKTGQKSAQATVRVVTKLIDWLQAEEKDKRVKGMPNAARMVRNFRDEAYKKAEILARALNCPAGLA